jgi:hypothetical protein
MTATPSDDATAASAQARGEAADSRHRTDALGQHGVSGSAMVAEQPSTPDDISVAWSPADASARPSLSPSTPRPVNSAERDPSDPT